MSAFLNRPVLREPGLGYPISRIRLRRYSSQAPSYRQPNITVNVCGNLFHVPLFRQIPSFRLQLLLFRQGHPARINAPYGLSTPVRNFSILSKRLPYTPHEHRIIPLQSRLQDRLFSRLLHYSPLARYDRLQALEDAANRDRHNANAQAVFLQVFLPSRNHLIRRRYLKNIQSS